MLHFLREHLPFPRPPRRSLPVPERARTRSGIPDREIGLLAAASSIRALSAPRPLLLRPDAERLHLAIQIAPLQPQQLRCPRHIPIRLFQLLTDIFLLRRFPD